LTIALNFEHVQAWVVAHEIPQRVVGLAALNGVRTLSVSESRCEQLIRDHDLSDEVLFGKRIGRKILHGGSGTAGMWERVETSAAFDQIPQEIAVALKSLELRPHVSIHAGKMQIALHYRGIKLGGVNRSHRHFYVSDGVVIRDEFARHLSAKGFTLIRKPSGHHEHSWWQLSWGRVEDFVGAIYEAQGVVDRALLVEQ